MNLKELLLNFTGILRNSQDVEEIFKNSKEFKTCFRTLKGILRNSKEF